MNTKQNIIEVKDGSVTGFSQPLCPEMMIGKGLKVKSTVKGTYFRYGREYVKSYLENALLKPLGVYCLEDANTLLEEVYS